MILEAIEQGTDEWQQIRCGVVTASNFKLVLTKGQGKTRRAYMVRLALEIVTGKPTESIYWNEAMARGTEMEPFARNAYKHITSNEVKEVGITFLDKHRRIGASPDGLIGEDGGLEIKCPLLTTHSKYLQDNKIPNQYKAQVQGNLWVSGREWWDFVSYAPEVPQKTLICRSYRDEAYIDNLKMEVALFIQELDQMVANMS